MNDMLLQGVAGQKKDVYFFLELGCQTSNIGSLGLLCIDVVEVLLL